ncbi:hypothetical protein J3459_015959 [Metarhizium acridum]|nr:hypothetical protein J3459_015959 [Metarhizium acridum]
MPVPITHGYSTGRQTQPPRKYSIRIHYSQRAGADDISRFKHHAICLEFILESYGICLRDNCDSAVSTPPQFCRLAGRFEYILRRLSSPSVQDKPLSRLDTSSLEDLKQIWAWEETVLESCDQTVHQIFGQVAEKQPGAAAICSWDGDFTYGRLNDVSTRIAPELIQF